jgi:hypothetical protein
LLLNDDIDKILKIRTKYNYGLSAQARRLLSGASAKLALNHPKDGFCPKFPQKPSRRRNRLAELASKALVMVILSGEI